MNAACNRWAQSIRFSPLVWPHSIIIKLFSLCLNISSGFGNCVFCKIKRIPQGCVYIDLWKMQFIFCVHKTLAEKGIQCLMDFAGWWALVCVGEILNRYAQTCVRMTLVVWHNGIECDASSYPKMYVFLCVWTVCGIECSFSGWKGVE